MKNLYILSILQIRDQSGKSINPLWEGNKDEVEIKRIYTKLEINITTGLAYVEPYLLIRINSA